MVCVHPYGHVIVPSWPFTSTVSRSSPFQSPLVAVSSGLFARAVKQVHFYPWGIFALFNDYPTCRVFTPAGIPQGFNLVIGKIIIFGQTPRDIKEKKIEVYVHHNQQQQQQQQLQQQQQQQEEYSSSYTYNKKHTPDLTNIHKVLKVCPFIPPKELYIYKEENNIDSDQVPMRVYYRMLRLAVSLAGKLVSVVSEGDFTLGISRCCCMQPQPLIHTPSITSPTEDIVSSGFPNLTDGLFSSQLIGYYDVPSGKYYKCPVGHGYWILGE